MEGDRAATARWRALAVIIAVAAALTIRVALNLSPG
ncbi:MAG: hypothetical protein JWR81_1595 [Pseudonocardia sp.]|jgi:hypothetical protein|nr:hypothetical protein [Pseudonocardia sp.]